MHADDQLPRASHEPAFEADPHLFQAAQGMEAAIAAATEAPAGTRPHEAIGAGAAPGEQPPPSSRRNLIRLTAVAAAIGIAILGYQLLTPKPKPLAGMEPAQDIAAMPLDGARPSIPAPSQAQLPVREPLPEPPPQQEALPTQQVPADRAAAETASRPSGSAMAAPPSMTPTAALESRIASLEAQVAELSSRSSAPASPAPAVASTTPGNDHRSVPAAAHPSHQDAARMVAGRSARATAPEPVVVPPPPTLGGQLLSVDLWGGQVSVVVTSGLPGDTRTRTLKPGDSVNGVTLQSADPSSQTATFTAGGRSFTLSTRQGS